MIRSRFLPAVILSTFMVSTASAHYLWVAIDAKTGEHGTVNLFFEGGPSPGDGKYLDPFVERGTTWIRTVSSPEPAPLKLEVVKEPGKRWLSGPATASGPRSIDSYGKWGVYRYGKTDVLLHYYARNVDVKSQDELSKLGSAEQLSFDVSIRQADGKIQLTTVWKGKPVGGRKVTVRGPQRFSEVVTTDDEGNASFVPEAKGRYSIAASHEEQQGGTDDGKDYQKIRHNFRMLANLPVE